MPNINLRVTDEQKAEVERAAKGAGVSLSEWAKARLGLSGPDRVAASSSRAPAAPSSGPESSNLVPSEPAYPGLRAGPVKQQTGCPLCGEATGQLHKPSCYLGGSVTA